MNKKVLAIGIATLCLAGHSLAGPADAQRLGKDLNPFGGIMAGNKDGSIPEWKDEYVKPPEGYAGSGTEYLNPFADDKQLFKITKDNIDQYKEFLSAGQLAMFKEVPKEFTMPVYKTRRTFNAPEWVKKNTRQNAAKASLAKNGDGILNAYGGVPFPVPKSGVEVIWNHITRWQGERFSETNSSVEVHANGKWSGLQYDAWTSYNFYRPDGDASTLDNILFYTLAEYTYPNQVAGNMSLVHETVDQVSEPRKAWNYLPGQRRVRRAPGLAYDQSSSFILSDETDMYNGAPDRYEWTLVGKKEMYVPYNNYKLSSKSLTYDKLLGNRSIDPRTARWEKHRVWVVEGKLKDGLRHVFAKRRFYVDEDSWAILMSEAYDGRGELWKVSFAYTINAYDISAITNELVVYHDLIAKKYAVDFLDNELSGARNFAMSAQRASFWKPASLRRKGRR